MNIHPRDRRKLFAVNFGRTYVKSAPLAAPSLALGLALPCLLCFFALTAMGTDSSGMVLAAMPRIFAFPAVMDAKIQELRDELLDLNSRAQTIQATADAEKRALTEDEQKELDVVFAKFGQLEEEIERRERISAQTAKLLEGQGRKVEPQAPVDPPQNSGEPARPRPQARPVIQVLEDRGKWGFKHLGDFAMAVRHASAKVANLDPRLVANAPTSVSQEAVGADGGYLVPPEFRTEIWSKVAGEDTLFGMTDQYPTARNSMVFPSDENTPWDTSNGVQAYWEGEKGQRSQSKVDLQEKSLRLNKLTSLIPVSEELLEDAVAIDGYLRRKVAEKFDFKLNLGIVQGTGAGEPLGILNAASIVSVQKESDQVADSILVENIDKMWSRMYAKLRPNAVWLANQDVEAQLPGMMRYVRDTSGAIVGGTPAYMPPGGISGQPYGTLYGRPIIPTQACETLGDKGDIILVDLKQYQTLYKTGGMKTDVSMHLWFDYDVAAYKFTLRVTGRPWWAAAASSRDGSNTLSWAVTLDERA